jgi:methyl-accepting chemotaxis protein
MEMLQTPLGPLELKVVAICLGILLIGFVGYFFVARPKLSRAWQQLERFAVLVEESDPASDTVVLNEAAEATPWLRQAWKMTGSRMLVIGRGDKQRRVLLGSVHDIWQPERMLHKHFNLPLFEAVPNIAVGVGLFFTFLFLTLALTDATTALSAAGGANPVGATKGLLSSAGGKFLSSLAGLAVSLAWTVGGKRAWARVRRASDHVVMAIEAWWPPVGAEAAVVEQLAHLSAVGDKLREHHETALDHSGLVGDMLIESREQTGVLKRFETDLAMSIGKAVATGFSPQVEQMTSRLEKAISDLSERMSSMNEEALRTMMKDFSQAISANTADEMKQFKDTLSMLSGKLDASAELLKLGVEDAASQLGEAAQGMTSGIHAATEKMSSDIAAAARGLAASVGGMEQVISQAAGAVQEIDATVRRAAAIGARGVEQMDRSIETAHALVDALGDVGETWAKVSGGVSGLAANLAEASDAVEELAEGQRAVVRTLQAAGPEVLGAVSQMRSQMEGTSRAVADAMQQVQGAMGRTSQDLSGVVSAIKEGVTEYSRQLAALHLEMDSALAKAVSKLGGAIQNLDESIEDLNDGLESFRGKG